MPTLYLKQKVFSWRDQGTVKNAAGEDAYFVEGEVFSLGKKLHLCDMTGNEVAYIQQKVWSWRPRFFVFLQGIQAAEIVKEFTFMRPKYTINGPGWHCEGDLWAHDYEIFSDGGRSIVRVHKAWFSWGDSYELEIADARDEALALAVVLAIDAVMDAEAAASSSSGGSSGSK